MELEAIGNPQVYTSKAMPQDQKFHSTWKICSRPQTFAYSYMQIPRRQLSLLICAYVLTWTLAAPPPTSAEHLGGPASETRPICHVAAKTQGWTAAGL